MSKALPKLTAAQLKTYEVMSRVRMAWATLIVVLGLFGAAFIVFVIALFAFPENTVANGILGGIDAALFWPLQRVVSNLFPAAGSAPRA